MVLLVVVGLVIIETEVAIGIGIHPRIIKRGVVVQQLGIHAIPGLICFLGAAKQQHFKQTGFSHQAALQEIGF